MASEVTIKLKHSDNSRSLTETFGCADTHPKSEVIKQLELELLAKWEAMGNSYRDIQIHTTIKQT